MFLCLVPILLFSHATVSYNFCLYLLTLHESIPTKPTEHNSSLKVCNLKDNKEICACYATRQFITISKNLSLARFLNHINQVFITFLLRFF
jgi:hypothetical protein